MTEHEFIDSIRQQYIGLSDMPRKSLASSVKTLADDLYAKDTHFIFELIQNAEDNDYQANTSPNLRFEVCQQDIDGQFVSVLIVHNNETGFQEEHVKGICQVGNSTKKKLQGYIGEKGIGFKSVFRITKCPYIFSNHFQFCLPEYDDETGLGYIVPQWVTNLPSGIVTDKTTIILPINKNEADAHSVANALRDIAPETILFLKKLCSIEVSVCLPLDQYEVVIEKSVKADSGRSMLVELTYLKKNGGAEEICESTQYWLTEVEFSKPTDIQHEKRTGIESRTVSVAIPLQPTTQKGKLFAYLPVWEETRFPFLINADFLLVSSREGVKEDEPWNKWLRDCIVETYVTSFLDLLHAPNLSIETKISAYRSIPMESHHSFLTPIIQPIQKRLSEIDCVLVLPNQSLVAPARARICYQNFRSVLGEHFPRYVCEKAWLVAPEIEIFSGQLKVIGVKIFTLQEIVFCLQDDDWVHNHNLTWFVDLFQYLKSQKFEPTVLQCLEMVPITQPEQDGLWLSSAKEQPIYFACNDADQDAISHVPKWLYDFVPIAFLNSDFLGIIGSHKDSEALRKWLTEVLNVYDFSIENYCVDILVKLSQEYQKITNDRLIEATKFIADHVESNFNWNNLPVVLSNGQKRLLQADRSQSEQPIVVPENFDPIAGWQHIWAIPKDRNHFVALAQGYRSFSEKWFDLLKIRHYPAFEKIKYDYLQSIPSTLPEHTLFQQCLYKEAASRSNETRVSSYKTPVSFIKTDESLAKSLQGLLITLDIPQPDSWNYKDKLHELGFMALGVYHYYGEKTEYSDSEILQKLRTLAWLPTTKGFVRPSQAFLNKQGTKEIFGDTVPYFTGNLSENALRLLGVRFDGTVQELLALLKEESGSTNANSDLVNKIYSELNARFQSSAQEIRKRFSSEALILVKDKQIPQRWCKISECVWEDASAVLGNDFAYLSEQYPKLREFFVDRLTIKQRVDTECFAQRWIKLQDKPLSNIQEQRDLVDKLYREIKPIALQQQTSRPTWWSKFAEEAKVYTKSDTFEQPSKVILPDDGELSDIFQRSGVKFAWRPGDDAFSDWSSFYSVFRTPLLSSSVTEHLEKDVEYQKVSSRRFMTDSAIKMIVAWLREKRKPDYEQLRDRGDFAQLISLSEATTLSDIKVEFRLKVNAINGSKIETYQIFWERKKNILIYGNTPKKSQIAKAISKGLIANRTDKDFAHWIELVLEASNTDRLKDENWSVPQEILNLFPQNTSALGPSGILPIPIDESAPTHFSPEANNPITQPINQAIPPQSSVTSHTDVTEGIAKVSNHQNLSPNTENVLKMPPQPQNVEEPTIEDKDRLSDGYSTNQAQNEIQYSELLPKAFNRDGQTEFDTETESKMHNFGSTTVRNPTRRGEKLLAGFRDNIDSEPSPEERRYTTERSLLEGPNESVRVSLLEWYGGKCQICDETWPKRDGAPYFAAAYLVERSYARWIDEPANAICLCAKHFAQWRHSAIESPADVVERISSLRLSAEGGDGDLSIHFSMCGENHSITYNERHLLALRKLIEVANREDDNG